MKRIILATIIGFLASSETEGILEIYDHEPAFTSTVPPSGSQFQSKYHLY